MILGMEKKRAFLVLIMKQVTPFKIATGLLCLINVLFSSILLYSWLYEWYGKASIL